MRTAYFLLFVGFRSILGLTSFFAPWRTGNPIFGRFGFAFAPAFGRAEAALRRC
jgi:hypothetical protein